jgi:hypothetical protein
LGQSGQELREETDSSRGSSRMRLQFELETAPVWATLERNRAIRVQWEEGVARSCLADRWSPGGSCMMLR